jgi:hypothetical protein
MIELVRISSPNHHGERSLRNDRATLLRQGIPHALAFSFPDKFGLQQRLVIVREGEQKCTDIADAGADSDDAHPDAIKQPQRQPHNWIML